MPSARSKPQQRNAASQGSDHSHATGTVPGWDSYRRSAIVRLHERVGRVPAPRLSSLVGERRPEERKQLGGSLAAAGPSRMRLDLKLGPDDARENPEARSAFRFRDACASIAVHIVLIVLLALIGLKAPTRPAGLALTPAATNRSEEIVEIPSEAETSDVQQDVQPELVEVASEAASELDALQDSLTDALDQAIDSQPETAAAKLGSAMQAIQSMPMGSNASFFGAGAEGNCFCFVIDASGSMRGAAWQTARDELLRSLGQLNADQRFYIILFTRSLIPITDPESGEVASHALYATPDNLRHASDWLMTAKIGGSGAAPKRCIELAIQKKPDAIFLLTDGVTKVTDVAEYIQEKNRLNDLISGVRVRVPIHTIAFFSDKGAALLRRIAAENSGQFRYVPAPPDAR